MNPVFTHTCLSSHVLVDEVTGTHALGFCYPGPSLFLSSVFPCRPGDTLQPRSLPLEEMALPSSLQDFIPHFHLRLHPHGLFCATSCRRSRTESSGKTPTFRSALRPVLPTPKSPFVVCSQLRRLLQHPPGKCPGCSHSPAPKPSHLQVLAGAPASYLCLSLVVLW